LKRHEVGGIIISPTRELATQTSRVLACFLHRIEHITQMLLVGGNSVSADVDCFRAKGANILIATPGRLEDLLTRKYDINLPAAVKSLVCINAHITAFITLLVLFKYVIVFEI
jgi:ATP-dependent RNA helicase DDX55/SPB4